MLTCFLDIDNKSNKMSSHLYPPNSSEEMKNEKQEKERLQGELKQMVEKYSVLLQRLLERCDQLVEERDQLQKERDQLYKEKQCFHEKEFSKKRTAEAVTAAGRGPVYQCSPAMATCDGLYDPPM
jgi:DNA repair ATPase RecN